MEYVKPMSNPHEGPSWVWAALCAPVEGKLIDKHSSLRPYAPDQRFSNVTFIPITGNPVSVQIVTPQVRRWGLKLTHWSTHQA